ncbi:MAG: IS630 family transposase, partial [Candidatus Scalindua sp.]
TTSADVQNKGIRLIQRHVIKHLYNNKVKTRIIACCLACHISTVRRWINRDELQDISRAGRPVIYSQSAHLSLIGFYCQTRPLSQCGRWTLRFAEKYLEKHIDIIGAAISKSTIHRILQANNLKPHRSTYFLHISDPDFFPKMNHLIELYFNPPNNLYCFDECPGIQVLQRLSPDMQTESMKIRLEEFEYIRNGTIDVLAFYSVNTGKVYAGCRRNHTKETLVEVFESQLKIAHSSEPLHYIMDNLYSHCCYELCELIAKYSNVDCPSEKELDTMQKRREWLMGDSKRIIFHYTPFHGSWLNQVEIWFGILNAKCLHESYSPPEAMYKTINEFNELWNTLLAKPVNWEYTGKGLPEKVVKRFIQMLYAPVENMDVRFTVKQLKLMTNIIKDYRQEIPNSIWNGLRKVLNKKYEAIKTNFINDKSKDKKRNERIESLDCLVKLLKSKLKTHFNIAA